MIVLDKLTKIYGAGAQAATVLDRIDIRVDKGEILAVVGPSGAGKSTLARCINLLEPPSSGSVVVDGRELTGLREAELRVARRSIGTVFQASHLLSRRTAAGNVALPLEYLGVVAEEREARVAELLDQVGLARHARHYPHQLSGGQRQRVGIARALALRPSVLLADEATSGLDPGNVTAIVELLRELRRELGLTILMITHDMQMVRRIADRVARLSNGRIVEEGRLVDLLTTPGSDLGHSLLPATADDALPQAAHGQVWRVHYRGDGTPSNWLTRLAHALGGDIQLLSALVETIGGVQVGHAAIGLPGHARAEHVRHLLAGLGLHGTRIGDPGRTIDACAQRAAA